VTKGSEALDDHRSTSTVIPASTAITLLCVPYAGAGASIFHSWRGLAPAGLTVVGLQLPGRENLLRLPPPVTMREAIDEMLPAAAAQFDTGNPVALFGHSLGALLSFELARRLEATGCQLTRLFVSGAAPPTSPPDLAIGGLCDDGLVARVRDVTGYEHPALAEPELRELLLPALRADLTLQAAYRAEPGAVVTVPITAIRGSRDDFVSLSLLAGWSAMTTGAFDMLEVDGAHMYFVSEPSALLVTLARRLWPAPQSIGGRPS